MIGKYAKNKSETLDMERAMESSRRTEIRGRQSTILGSVYQWYTFYPVHAFTVGYVSGRSTVESARSSASSSGGSSSGYGSSGGSFSGSGSSSSF